MSTEWQPNLDMVKGPLKVVIDTNVLVSGIVFEGKPHRIIRDLVDRRIHAVGSRFLLAELAEVLTKKMNYSSAEINRLIEKLEELIDLVHPEEIITVCRDPADNWVLEAAVAGNCDFIITGDRDLLTLKKYRSIQILTPAEFIAEIETN